MMRYLIVVIAVVVGWVGLAAGASGHEWYSKRRDPVFNKTTCCGGADCAPLPAAAMKITPEGLVVTLTAEEAHRINPLRSVPFQQLIDFDRVQLSEDGMPHICLQPTQSLSDARQGYYCIFLPPQG